MIREMQTMAVFILFISFLTFGGKHKNHEEHSDKKGNPKLSHDHHEKDHDHREKKHEHNNEKNESSGKINKHDHDHDHGHEEGGGKIGKGKAINEVDEIKGFSLSIEAIKTLKLKFKKIRKRTFFIEKSTLVSSKQFKGIYRLRGGFFKFISVVILKSTKKGFIISSRELGKEDQVVVSGVGLLRVADVFSTDESEYGHSH